MAKEFKDWVDEFVENGANPKDVTNWPEEAGGGSTGSVIVTDLPEQGVQGTTYLLKKPNPFVEMKVLTHIGLEGYNTYNYIISNTKTELADILESILKKLGNPSTTEIGFEYYGYPSYQDEEWYERQKNNPSVAIIHSEEELATLDVNTITNIYFEHIVYLEDIYLTEAHGDYSSGQYYYELKVYWDSLALKNEIVDGKLINYERYVVIENNHFVLTNWEHYGSSIEDCPNILEQLVDRIEPQEYFSDKTEYEDVVYTTFTQEELTYNYTNYIFDNGKYVEIISASSGSDIHYLSVEAYDYSANYYNFTLLCDTLDLDSYDALAKYLDKKGRGKPLPIGYWSSDRVITGIYAYTNASIHLTYWEQNSGPSDAELKNLDFRIEYLS